MPLTTLANFLKSQSLEESGGRAARHVVAAQHQIVAYSPQENAPSTKRQNDATALWPRLRALPKYGPKHARPNSLQPTHYNVG